MDVTINGATVAANVDIAAAVGVNTVHFITSTVAASSEGKINVQIVAKVLRTPPCHCSGDPLHCAGPPIEANAQRAHARRRQRATSSQVGAAIVNGIRVAGPGIQPDGADRKPAGAPTSGTARLLARAIKNKLVPGFSALKGDVALGAVTTKTTTAEISGVAPNLVPALYQTQFLPKKQPQEITLVIPVTLGASYTLALHFAEILGASPGARKFDVVVDGVTMVGGRDPSVSPPARPCLLWRQVPPEACPSFFAP